MGQRVGGLLRCRLGKAVWALDGTELGSRGFNFHPSQHWGGVFVVFITTPLFSLLGLDLDGSRGRSLQRWGGHWRRGVLDAALSALSWTLTWCHAFSALVWKFDAFLLIVGNLGRCGVSDVVGLSVGLSDVDARGVLGSTSCLDFDAVVIPFPAPTGPLDWGFVWS